ncbi:hypothetical protein N7512_001044 [Penicillium capsulatum]|nr:hypothetical protein N7512_001044 [Penicillium capsulatum]
MGTEYKDIVKLLAYWSLQLCESVKKWDRGTIYLFDTNAFLLDRIRDWQLYAAGIKTENGLGQNQDPGWENVGEACVASESGIQVMMSKKGQSTPCAHPEKYLFWNEMHLGPSAHRLMATEIYSQIDGLLVN